MGLIKNIVDYTNDATNGKHQIHLDAVYDMVNNVKTSLRSLLAGKAALSHTHSQFEVSGLPATLGGKEDTSNKVTSLSAQSTNTQYPSAKCVYDELGNKAGSIDSMSATTEPIYLEDLLPSGIISLCHISWGSDEPITIGNLFPTKPGSEKTVYIRPTSYINQSVSKNQLVVCTACIHPTYIAVAILFVG